MNLTPEKLREITDRASKDALERMKMPPDMIFGNCLLSYDYEPDRYIREAFARSVVEQVDNEIESQASLIRTLEGERDSLHNQLAAHSWVPVSERKPTREDGDAEGIIQILHRDGWTSHVNWKLAIKEEYTHWRVANLPRPSKEKSEHERKKLDALIALVRPGASNQFKNDMWEARQAARARKETP